MARLKPLRTSSARRRAEHRRRRRDPGQAIRAKLQAVGLFALGAVIGGTAVAALLSSDLVAPWPATPSAGGEAVQLAAAPSPRVIVEREPARTVDRARANETRGPDQITDQIAGPASEPERAVSSEAVDAAAAIDGHRAETPPAPRTEPDPADGPAAPAEAEQPFDPPPPAIAVQEAAPAHAPVVYQEAAPTPADAAAASTNDDLKLSDLVQQARLQLDAPEISSRSGVPMWKANAVAVADAGGRPMIAVVLDDLGMNRPNTRRAIRLPAPLTLSFLTYAEHLDEFVGDARRAGHELLVHVPMEPSDASLDAGENVLRVDAGPAENVRRLRWGLDRFSGYVGINNHMGSRFTASGDAMAVVLAELRARGLLFLDSRTAVASVGARLAERMAVPFAERDVFIDNEPEDHEAIRRQLDELERVARRSGAAVGIGHPHDSTLDLLAEWLREAPWRGFTLVPVSRIVERKILLAGQAGSDG